MLHENMDLYRLIVHDRYVEDSRLKKRNKEDKEKSLLKVVL